MLKASEILLETIKKDGRPERLLRQYEGATFYPPNPANNYVRGNRHRGMEPMKDLFGTEILWPQEQLAAMPHVTEDNKVIDDITEWKEQLVIPDIVGQCSDPALWEPFKQKAQEIKDSGSLFMAFMPTGVFERLHFLMGFEDMLVNFLLEPEDMMDLCNAIGEYRFQLTKLIVDNLHPDIILSHDDWGSKQSLFISPDTWREFIKPQYERSYKYMKDHGVIIMHHADSFMEPIIEDMVDLGIDIWQGTLPQNDIPKLQKQLNGRMTLMGGIDASIVDRVDSTEEEIRKEVRRACEITSLLEELYHKRGANSIGGCKAKIIESGCKNQMIKCEKGNVSINGAGNEVIHDLSEIISRTYSSFSKAFGEEKTKQMIFKAVNAGMGADK